MSQHRGGRNFRVHFSLYGSLCLGLLLAVIAFILTFTTKSSVVQVVLLVLIVPLYLRALYLFLKRKEKTHAN